MSDTIAKRPLPKRPENGLLAWQATIGYISNQYSLDAMLMLQVYPVGGGNIAWAGTASWGQNQESVGNLPALPVTLRELWRVVDQNHVIFETKEAILKRPANYADHEWIDAQTDAILHQLIHITSAVYGDNWQLVFIYQPVANQAIRFQARLLAVGDSVQIGGQGASLSDAGHDLYRNAAPYYVAHSGRSLDDLG